MYDGNDPGTRNYLLTPELPFVGWARSGETVSFRTLDSSGNQIAEGVDYDALDHQRFFPVTGPVGIEGVKIGDAVGVEITHLRPGEAAHTWTRPGLGIGDSSQFHVRRIGASELEIDWGRTTRKIVAEQRPHIGALGLLPNHEMLPRSLGEHGGNVDSLNAQVGATMWFRAQVEGGGFFVGDVHAAMGDGEVCGTGAETPAELSVRFHVERNWTPSLPVLVGEDGRVSVIGIGDSIEEALKKGVEYCVEALALAEGMSKPDAYLAVGLLLKAHICQVVNPRYSVEVSLSGGMDDVLKPS